MKSTWPLSICATIGYVIGALAFCSAMTFLLATAMVAVVEYPNGYIGLLNYISKKNGIGGMIASAATIFSGSFVIVGVFVTIKNQNDIAEQDRISKLMARVSTLPSVYHELSKLCKRLTLFVVNRETEISKKDMELSKSSVNTIKLVLEVLRGNEYEELSKILLFYQLALMKFEGAFVNSNRRGSSNSHEEGDSFNPYERNLIIDLVSLQSIAEIYARSAIQGNNKFCMNLCRNQFKHNILRYNKWPGQIGDNIDDINRSLWLNIDENSTFDDNVGFLGDDYFKRYNI